MKLFVNFTKKFIRLKVTQAGKAHFDNRKAHFTKLFVPHFVCHQDRRSFSERVFSRVLVKKQSDGNVAFFICDFKCF